MENCQNILTQSSRFNTSLKSPEAIKDHIDMDQHQGMSEKENFNPKPLKEIALAGSDTNLAATNESSLKSANTTFDQASDDESFISTNDNLSFLTDGFNNIKLDSDSAADSTFEQAKPVNKTLTESSPTNSTFTEEKNPIDVIEVGEIAEETQNVEEKGSNVIESISPLNCDDQKVNSTFTDEKPGAQEEGGSHTPQKDSKYSDTLDEITAALAHADQSNSEVQQSHEIEILSPILPPEPISTIVDQELPSNTSHEINITSSLIFDHTDEENISDQVFSETNHEEEVRQESPPVLPETTQVSTEVNETVAFSSTFAVGSEISSQAYLAEPTPMEIDETFNDDTQTSPTENEATAIENAPQQTFEEKIVPGLAFDFKVPETSQQSLNNETQEEVKIAETSQQSLSNEMDQKVAEENQQEVIEEKAPEESHADKIEEELKTPEPSQQSLSNNMGEATQDEFKIPSMPSKRLSTEEFQSAASYNFGNFDLDVLQKFGNNSTPDFSIGRDSVLLRFDPLLEKIAPIDTQINQRITPTTTARLASTEEEDENCSEGQISSDKTLQDILLPVESLQSCTPPRDISPSPQLPSNADENGAMKDLDQVNETIESLQETKEFKELSDNSNQQLLLEQQKIEYEKKMTELESQLRKEAEMKEEALLKRITEKEKQMAKMNNVVEAYEKAIAELIAEKEQLIQSYEKKCLELKSDSETNSHHLASLESTFSDLHAKYERTKQIASELKEREETILTDRKALQEALKSQEARYEKMKTHAMSQLEIANTKLAEMQRNHQAEQTKLKAQLKKEEISRASITEQLHQKSKENAELVKICDELIGNHGHSQNA